MPACDLKDPPCLFLFLLPWWGLSSSLVLARPSVSPFVHPQRLLGSHRAGLWPSAGALPPRMQPTSGIRLWVGKVLGILLLLTPEDQCGFPCSQRPSHHWKVARGAGPGPTSRTTSRAKQLSRSSSKSIHPSLVPWEIYGMWGLKSPHEDTLCSWLNSGDRGPGWD